MYKEKAIYYQMQTKVKRFVNEILLGQLREQGQEENPWYK